MARKGFTLIELLVVIAVLAVLSVAVVLVLNPTELLKEGRDSVRISDVNSLSRVVALWLADANPSGWPLSAVCNSTGGTYINSGICSGRVFVTSTAVDGSGWVPLNLNLISSGAPLAKLPMDPARDSYTCWWATAGFPGGYRNDQRCGYFWISATSVGAYEIDAMMESSKFFFNTSTEVVTNDKDGGDRNDAYEIGSSLNLVQ